MDKYRVSAHVTIYVEMDIAAENAYEALKDFNLQLEEEYGWNDYDTAQIRPIGRD
jgi:hypothetical protein